MTEEKKKHPNTSALPIDAPSPLDYGTFLHLDATEVEAFSLPKLDMIFLGNGNGAN